MFLVLHLFDSEMRQIYVNITNFLVWSLKSGIVSERPDISLIYYPSVSDFYWFTARTLNLLEEYAEELPFEEMKYALNKLRVALRGDETNTILKNVHEDGQNYAFWEEFLGNYVDKDRGEDRIFATALSINTLLDIWTIKFRGNSFYYCNRKLTLTKKTSLGIKYAKPC